MAILAHQSTFVLKHKIRQTNVDCISNINHDHHNLLDCCLPPSDEGAACQWPSLSGFNPGTDNTVCLSLFLCLSVSLSLPFALYFSLTLSLSLSLSLCISIYLCAPPFVPPSLLTSHIHTTLPHSSTSLYLHRYCQSFSPSFFSKV